MANHEFQELDFQAVNPDEVVLPLYLDLSLEGNQIIPDPNAPAPVEEATVLDLADTIPVEKLATGAVATVVGASEAEEMPPSNAMPGTVNTTEVTAIDEEVTVTAPTMSSFAEQVDPVQATSVEPLSVDAVPSFTQSNVVEEAVTTTNLVNDATPATSNVSTSNKIGFGFEAFQASLMQQNLTATTAIASTDTGSLGAETELSAIAAEPTSTTTTEVAELGEASIPTAENTTALEIATPELSELSEMIADSTETSVLEEVPAKDPTSSVTLVAHIDEDNPHDVAEFTNLPIPKLDQEAVATEEVITTSPDAEPTIENTLVSTQVDETDNTASPVSTDNSGTTGISDISNTIHTVPNIDVHKLIDKARRSQPALDQAIHTASLVPEQQAALKESPLNKDRKAIPYAFIRFGNEAITLKQSLESILGYCDRGVLCYARHLPGVEDDGSVAIAQEFCEQNPGFKLVQYPIPIIPQNAPIIFEKLDAPEMHRYWLLDCLYNYTLLHLIELAKSNGEYDKAWLFKVDADHIYSVVNLNYAHATLEQHIDEIDCIFYGKYNVLADYRNYEYRGIKRLFKGLLSNKRPTIDNAWFHSWVQPRDHFLARLSVMRPFKTVVHMPYTDASGETIPGDYWETVYFKNTVRLADAANFLSSYHFFYEKTFSYEPVTNMELDHIYAVGHEYTGPDMDIYTELEYEFNLDKEFWSREHCLELLRSFNYPEDRKPSLIYGRNSANYQELMRNEIYRMENFLVGFNLKRNQLAPDDPEREVSNTEARVLQALFNYYTDKVYVTTSGNRSDF